MFFVFERHRVLFSVFEGGGVMYEHRNFLAGAK